MHTTRHAIAIGTTILLVLLATLALPEFGFEPDLTKMLPSDHPYVRLAAMLDQRAENRRSLFIVLRAGQREAGIDENSLAAIAEDLRNSPHVKSVAATRDELLGEEWRRRMDAPLWSLPPDKVHLLAQRLSQEGRRAALEETLRTLAEDPIGGREIAVRDPLELRWLLADALDLRLPLQLKEGSPYVIFADGRGALVRLVGRESALNPEFATTLLADVESRLAKSGWQHDMFGGYVIARTDAARIRHDLGSSILWSALLVTGYLLLSMRDLRYAVLAMVPVGLAAYCALSLGSYLFGPLTPVAIGAAAVLLGLGVDFVIHYIVRYIDHRQSSSHDDSIRRTHSELRSPLSVGMLTTAIAFLSLAFGRFGGLAGFGMLLAMGLLFAFLGALYLLPALLGLFRQQPKSMSTSIVASGLDRVAGGPVGPLVATVLIALSIGAFALVVVRGIDLSANPKTLRPDGDPVDVTRAKLEQELGMSLLPCFLLVSPDTAGDSVAKAIDALRAEGSIILAAAASGATPERRALVQQFHSQTADWFAGTLRDMDEMGFDTDPFRPGLAELRSKLDATEPPSQPGDTVQLDRRTWQAVLCYPAPRMMTYDGWPELQTRVRDVLGTDAKVYGTPTLQNELEDLLRHDLLQAALLTAVLAFGLVIMVSRSLRAGLLALIPTICALSLTLATLTLCGVSITIGNFVAIPFLLGIAVDDGVHLVSHLRRQASGVHTGATGVAVVRTSLTTIVAFGSLVTAQSPGLATLGWIIVLGVSCCLLTSLLVLPPIWSRFGYRGGRR